MKKDKGLLTEKVSLGDILLLKTFPKIFWSGVEKIDGLVFMNARIGGNLHIPSIKSIGSNAFENAHLNEVTIDEGLETISSDAFIKSTIKEINLPDTVQKISLSAFKKCEHLEKIILPKRLSYLGGKCFFEL